MSEQPPTRTKQTMHTRMQTGLAQFLAVLDGFSDEQMLVPVDAAGWNVRDHVTHLAVWADGIAAIARREDRWHAMGLAMTNPEGDEPDYDRLNAQIVAQHRQLSPAQARAWLIAAHERVTAAMEALTEADLAAPYERFVAPYTGTWGHPIAEYILGNTEDHYDEHTAWIRAIVQGASLPRT
jgi:hypothetical protein